MKKRIVALLLGGVLAAGSLAMQAPATAWAATEDGEASGITKEECGFDSEPHLKNFSIVAGDGQCTASVDIKHEVSGASVNIVMLDSELNKIASGDVQIYEVESEWEKEGRKADRKCEYVVPGEPCTFTGLENGKTYYLYFAVNDGHDSSGDGDGEALHRFAYLGSVAPASDSGSGSDGGSSSDNNTSDSGSSDSGSGDSTPATLPRDYAREAEERVCGQIQSAPAGSTVVMDKGITTLSNATMKELLNQGDISLKLDFTYMGQRYVITIPAGAALDDDIPWYGPLYLAQQFGNSAAANEVNAMGTEQELIEQIKKTPADYTIVMDKGVTTLSSSVIKELQKKGDVSLKLEFTYENKEYIIKIPAGAAFDDNIPWYGPLYLIQHFGNSAENAK